MKSLKLFNGPPGIEKEEPDMDDNGDSISSKSFR